MHRINLLSANYKKTEKMDEEFEDTKGVIWIRISKKNRPKRKSTKGQTTIYKTYT